ncbi:MAG: serine protease [Lachnospiraceae bacterium]|nr:serine protease [Lachnospiraceae bacterium]
MEEMEKKSGSSFVSETIKEKPINKKKLLRRTMTTVGLAIIFGLIACLTFFLMEPVINGIVNPTEITKVSFPEETEELKPEELLTEEEIAQQEESLQEVVEAAKKMVKSEQFGNKALDNYRDIYTQLQSLAEEASAAIVTVIAISEKQNWFAGTTENENTAAGLILAENGAEMLILADVNHFSNAHEYRVRFCDKNIVEAQLKEKDAQTGLGVYAVKLSDLPKETAQVIEKAKLGTSTSRNMVGSPALTIGAPYGTSGSLSYGMITTIEKKLTLNDAIYNVIMTDMGKSQNASGVIINLRGEVIGVVTQSADTASATGTIAALGISDIKPLIEKLSNDEKRAYIGIRGMDVTELAHEETGVPYGLYVSEVVTESPAMVAGIQNGDVIVSISGKKINSYSDYKASILSIQPETIVEVVLMRFDGTKYSDIKKEIMTGEAQ